MVTLRLIHGKAALPHFLTSSFSHAPNRLADVQRDATAIEKTVKCNFHGDTASFSPRIHHTVIIGLIRLRKSRAFDPMRRFWKYHEYQLRKMYIRQAIKETQHEPTVSLYLP